MFCHELCVIKLQSSVMVYEIVTMSCLEQCRKIAYNQTKRNLICGREAHERFMSIISGRYFLYQGSLPVNEIKCGLLASGSPCRLLAS